MKIELRTPLLVLVCASVLIPISAAAQAPEWDQSAVTKLAEQLAQSAGDLRRSVRRAPPLPSRSQRRARYRILDDLRVAEGSINSLARQLAAGSDREETFPTFRRIRTLRNDIANQIRRTQIGEPTLSKLETARELLEQLAPFYAAEEVD
jgi:hypothetical protein